MKNIATIDAFIHQMPGNTMPLFTVKQGPSRRIQTCVARKERIVQIDSPTFRCGQHVRRQDVVVEQTEQNVTGTDRQLSGEMLLIKLEDRNAMVDGPLSQAATGGHNHSEMMAAGGKHLRTLHGQTGITNQTDP